MFADGLILCDLDHVALMIELLGDIPKLVALSGSNSRRIFDRNGEARQALVLLRVLALSLVWRLGLIWVGLGALLHISKLKHWPLSAVLK
jgi:hypothetical protein